MLAFEKGVIYTGISTEMDVCGILFDYLLATSSGIAASDFVTATRAKADVSIKCDTYLPINDYVDDIVLSDVYANLDIISHSFSKNSEMVLDDFAIIPIKSIRAIYNKNGDFEEQLSTIVLTQKGGEQNTIETNISIQNFIDFFFAAAPGGSTPTPAGMIDITINNICALANNSNLVPGQMYRITDLHSDSGYNQNLNCIVEALSVSTLNNVGFCETYFAIGSTIIEYDYVQYEINTASFKIRKAIRKDRRGNVAYDTLSNFGIDGAIELWKWCDDMVIMNEIRTKVEFEDLFSPQTEVVAINKFFQFGKYKIKLTDVITESDIAGISISTSALGIVISASVVKGCSFNSQTFNVAIEDSRLENTTIEGTVDSPTNAIYTSYANIENSRIVGYDSVSIMQSTLSMAYFSPFQYGQSFECLLSTVEDISLDYNFNMVNINSSRFRRIYSTKQDSTSFASNIDLYRSDINNMKINYYNGSFIGYFTLGDVRVSNATLEFPDANNYGMIIPKTDFVSANATIEDSTIDMRYAGARTVVVYFSHIKDTQIVIRDFVNVQNINAYEYSSCVFNGSQINYKSFNSTYRHKVINSLFSGDLQNASVIEKSVSIENSEVNLHDDASNEIHFKSLNIDNSKIELKKLLFETVNLVVRDFNLKHYQSYIGNSHDNFTIDGTLFGINYLNTAGNMVFNNYGKVLEISSTKSDLAVIGSPITGTVIVNSAGTYTINPPLYAGKVFMRDCDSSITVDSIATQYVAANTSLFFVNVNAGGLQMQFVPTGSIPYADRAHLMDNTLGAPTTTTFYQNIHSFRMVTINEPFSGSQINTAIKEY